MINEATLNQIGRIERMSQGQASLVLISCKGKKDKELVSKFLNHLKQGKLNKERNLKEVVIKAAEGDQSGVLVEIEGMDDNFISGTNMVRNDFMKEYKGPVFTLTDEASISNLMRKAPDFFSWCTVVE